MADIPPKTHKGPLAGPSDGDLLAECLHMSSHGQLAHGRLQFRSCALNNSIDLLQYHPPPSTANAIRGKDRAAAQVWDDIMERAREEKPKSVN